MLEKGPLHLWDRSTWVTPGQPWNSTSSATSGVAVLSLGWCLQLGSLCRNITFSGHAMWLIVHRTRFS